MELLCASGENPNACEVARRYSTSYHNIQDICSPVDADVLAYGTQALANDTRCLTATSVDSGPGQTDQCPVRIGLRWNMLLREVPQSARSADLDGTVPASAQTRNTPPDMLSVDETRAAGGSTNALWVLVEFDGSEDSISYTFLPIDLYPGSQGVALMVFQVIFLIFTYVWLACPALTTRPF